MKETSSHTQYILSFDAKLSNLDVNSLLLENYPKDYLRRLLDNSSYYLHIYAEVLDKLVAYTSVAKEELALVDYGAGNGLLGMFAKHCGFKKVYLNDLSSTFLNAAKQVATVLNIDIDGFIVGDCNHLKNYFSNKNKPNAIIGTDVIEHIYSLENFFSCIHDINSQTTTVFTTASVTTNAIKSKQLMQLQYQDENISSNAEHAMEGDEFAGKSFIETRKAIIKRILSDLDTNALNTLAKATRGLIKRDIEQVVEDYIKTKKLPTPPVHPTNTCDPITGSWTERLLTEKEYELIYDQAKFQLKTSNGFYNQWQTGPKGIALKLANKTIALLGKQGNIITPFITLVGYPK